MKFLLLLCPLAALVRASTLTLRESAAESVTFPLNLGPNSVEGASDAGYPKRACTTNPKSGHITAAEYCLRQLYSHKKDDRIKIFSNGMYPLISLDHHFIICQFDNNTKALPLQEIPASSFAVEAGF